MEHKYLFITENNKLYVFFLLSLLLHISVLFFFINNKNTKKLFYIKLNNTVSTITVEDFSIVTSQNGEYIGLNKKSAGQKQAGAITKNINGINNPAPEYPALALKWGYEGVVKLKISINTSGKVYNVKVIKSSGYKILDNEAVRTAYRWRFEKIKKSVVVEKDILFKIE